MEIKRMMYLSSLLLMAWPLAAMGGCGSGSSDSASAAEALSKPEFIRRADAACEKVEAAKGQVAKRVFATQIPKGATYRHRLEKAIAQEVLPMYQQLISELAQLSPPLQDKQQVAGVIEAYEAAFKKAEADPARLIDTDPFQSANDAAQRYGVKHCVL